MSWTADNRHFLRNIVEIRQNSECQSAKSLVFQRWINDEIALRKNRLTKYADSNYKMNKICSNAWQRQHSQDYLFCWLAISFLLMHNKSYDCVHQ